MPENERPKLPSYITKEDIARWNGYWHAKRRILVSGELNGDSIMKATQELMKLDCLDSKPILLMIDSGGGSVIPTQQLEDTMNSLNSPVDALVIGDCASMAVDLVQMCRTRYILPSARMLVHYIRHTRVWIADDLEQLETDLAYFRQEMRETAVRRLDLYSRRMGLSRDEITAMFRYGEVHRAYFTAGQIIEKKLADEVMTDFKIFPRRDRAKKQGS